MLSGLASDRLVVKPKYLLMPKSLSRNSSLSSVSTDDSAVPGVFVDGLVRRTRKRFTQEQLTMLESLYYQTQHPSRVQRDDVARRGNMYVALPRRLILKINFYC